MKPETLQDHKVFDLANRLSVGHVQAVGVIESLWHFTDEHAPDGDVGKFTNAAIAAGISCSIDPDLLVEALVAAGWLIQSPNGKRYRRLMLLRGWHELDESAEESEDSRR